MSHPSCPLPEVTVVRFRLDGAIVAREVTADATLIDVLREDLGATVTKVGCRVGRCGACMVLLDDRVVNACLVPAHRLDGVRVVTAAGLDAIAEARSIRDALESGNAFQCGYCAPGMVMAILALVRRGGTPDRAAIAMALAGNICRCTGYASIVATVERMLIEMPA